MSSDGKVVQYAIALLRAGKKAEAREALRRYITTNSDNPMAWAAMVQVADSPAEKRYCLKQVLRLKPDDAWATKCLQSLGAVSQAPPPATPPAGVTPALSVPPAGEPAPGLPPAQAGPAPAQVVTPSGKPLTPIAERRQSQDLKAYSMFTVVALAFIVILIIGVIYGVYSEYYASYPGDKDEVLAVARQWTDAQAVGNFDKMNELSCGQYTRGPTDPLTGFIMQRMEEGIQQLGQVMDAQAPQNLKYEVISIGGNQARLQVTGFMSRPYADYAGLLDQATYDRLNENVYLLQRESGKWKWCGFEE